MDNSFNVLSGFSGNREWSGEVQISKPQVETLQASQSQGYGGQEPRGRVKVGSFSQNAKLLSAQHYEGTYDDWDEKF